MYLPIATLLSHITIIFFDSPLRHVELPQHVTLSVRISFKSYYSSISMEHLSFNLTHTILESTSLITITVICSLTLLQVMSHCHNFYIVCENLLQVTLHSHIKHLLWLVKPHYTLKSLFHFIPHYMSLHHLQWLLFKPYWILTCLVTLCMTLSSQTPF